MIGVSHAFDPIYVLGWCLCLTCLCPKHPWAAQLFCGSQSVAVWALVCKVLYVSRAHFLWHLLIKPFQATSNILLFSRNSVHGKYSMQRSGAKYKPLCFSDMMLYIFLRFLMASFQPVSFICILVLS